MNQIHSKLPHRDLESIHLKCAHAIYKLPRPQSRRLMNSSVISGYFAAIRMSNRSDKRFSKRGPALRGRTPAGLPKQSRGRIGPRFSRTLCRGSKFSSLGRFDVHQVIEIPDAVRVEIMSFLRERPSMWRICGTRPPLTHHSFFGPPLLLGRVCLIRRALGVRGHCCFVEAKEAERPMCAGLIKSEPDS